MAAEKPIGSTGLAHLWSKLKAWVEANFATKAYVASANAASATKLQTARTINMSTAAIGTATAFDGTKNIAIPVTNLKEAYLSFGGKNITGGYSALDAAMIPSLGANRLAFAKAAGITVQYSRDGGSTWTDYGASDAAKVGLFSPCGSNLTIGKNTTAGANAANYLLRITIDTGAAGVYTVLNKFAIYVSSNGSQGCYCTIDAAIKNTPTTFVNFANKVSLTGWSGWNVINVSGFTTYGNQAASQYGIVRFTFGCTGHSGNYTGLSVLSIFGYGGYGWTAPSTMAKTGYLYSMDASQNATFPANVKAASFTGPLSGNAATATKLATKRTIKLSGDVTGSGTFDGSGDLTITTTSKSSVATASADGLMSAADKAKLDKIAYMLGIDDTGVYVEDL